VLEMRHTGIERVESGDPGTDFEEIEKDVVMQVRPRKAKRFALNILD
jgi:hypothetical protein